MRRRPQKLHFTEEQLSEMAALYRHGWSCDQLAVLFGCLSGSIQKRLLKMGVEMRPKKRWRHKVSFHSSGYILWGGTYVHRIVAEAMLDRPLLPGEVVHHIDGDKTNNHPDNLQVFASHSEHMSAETWRRKWTPEMEALLIQRRGEGATAAQIAQELGLTRAAVNVHAAEMVASGRTPSRAGWRRSAA